MNNLTQYLVMMCALQCLTCYVDAGFCHGEGVGVVVDVDFMGYKEMLREMRASKRCDLKRGCETLGGALLESLCDLRKGCKTLV